MKFKGLTFGVTGSTLLDLEILTGGTSDQVSFTFVGRSISAFFGALTAGAVISKFNPWLLLAIYFFPFGCFHTAVPWSRSIVVLAVFIVLRGYFNAFYDAGGNVTLLNIWGKDNGPWMQALHFLFGVGGLLGILLAKPFIYIYPDVGDRYLTNSTVSAENSVENVTTQAESGLDNVALNDMKVWIAYLVTGVIISCVSCALFCVFLTGDRRFRQMRRERRRSESDKEEKCFKFTIVGLVMALAFTYCIIEINYINFAMVFLVKHLGLPKSTATSISAAFWASFTAGRGMGIFLAMLCTPQLMLALSVLGVMVFLAPQPFALLMPDWIIWACTVGFGLSLSITFATTLTWMERYIKVEGMVGVMFMVAGALGDMVGPVTIGILFKQHGPGALMLFLLATSVLMFCLYIALQCIGSRHGERKREPSENNPEELEMSVPGNVECNES